MGDALIQIKQLPIIEERLREVKARWEQAAADNMSLICTADTVQTVKAARADLTRQFKELEALRKSIKSRYMEAYLAFEATYKECITDPYGRADADLKSKIDATESEIKQQCEARCRAYFDELARVHGVADFVSFSQVGLKIDLASAKAETPRALFDQIGEWVARVAEDLYRLDKAYTGDEHDEIIMEFKKSLNPGNAVYTVQQRQRQLEWERQAAQERAERARQEAERVAAVEAAAAPPVQVEAEPQEVQPEPIAKFPRKISFTILPETLEQYQSIRPVLLTLRELLKSGGIRYE